MAPNCKTGSEVVWIAQWQWDADKKEAFRTPATGYFTSDQKEKYGGKCPQPGREATMATLVTECSCDYHAHG